MNQKSVVLFISVGFLWCLLLACSGSGGGSPTAPNGVSPGQVEFQSTKLVNSERAARDCDPQLRLEQRLAAVARAHSEAMRAEGRLFHNGVDGRLETRLREAGIVFSVAAENVAMVGGTSNPAARAHSLLMESPDHRDNILSARVSMLGVGTVASDDTYWITQIFVDP